MFAKILQVSTDEQMGKYSYCSKLVEFKTQNLLRDKRGTAKYLDITIRAKFWGVNKVHYGLHEDSE